MYDEAEMYLGQQVVSPTLSDIKYRAHVRSRSREGSRSPSPSGRSESPRTKLAPLNHVATLPSFSSSFRDPLDILPQKAKTLPDIDLVVDLERND